jgi:prepilin-type N-terminal cleavage/methylation domain-containing protein
MAREGERGFTLLEILVGLIVLGFLSLALTQGARFGVQAWTAQARAVAQTADLDAADRTVRGLIERMNPGSVTGLTTKIDGDARHLSFASVLPRAASGLPTPEADVELTTDASRHLLMLWKPHYRNVIVSRPPTRTELLDGVERLEFSYWAAAEDGAGGRWETTWQQPAPPALVRLRIVFAKGDKRVWPDIVAAPMRERARL